MKNIVIIGGGIASYALIPALEPSLNKITLIDGQDFIPNCSDNSTAINCLRGIKKGISPLGDILVDAHQAFMSFIDQYHPDGIEEGIEQIFFNKGEEQLLKRYPDFQQVAQSNLIGDKDYFSQLTAYFWNFSKFKKWVQREFEHEKIKDYVKEVSENKVILHSGESIKFDKLICTTNNTTDYLKDVSAEYQLYRSKLKAVQGSYLEAVANHTLDFSFSLKFDKVQFIYRKDTNIIQIGSTSSPVDFYLQNQEKLYSHYKSCKHHLRISLPDFNQFLVKTGVRQKGPKRMPLWSEVAPNIFVINGLYKNGFSYSFLASKTISSSLL